MIKRQLGIGEIKAIIVLKNVQIQCEQAFIEIIRSALPNKLNSICIRRKDLRFKANVSYGGEYYVTVDLRSYTENIYLISTQYKALIDRWMKAKTDIKLIKTGEKTVDDLLLEKLSNDT